MIAAWPVGYRYHSARQVVVAFDRVLEGLVWAAEGVAVLDWDQRFAKSLVIANRDQYPLGAVVHDDLQWFHQRTHRQDVA